MGREKRENKMKNFQIVLVSITLLAVFFSIITRMPQIGTVHREPMQCEVFYL